MDFKRVLTTGIDIYVHSFMEYYIKQLSIKLLPCPRGGKNEFFIH